jgi:hypothetical protein
VECNVTFDPILGVICEVPCDLGEISQWVFTPPLGGDAIKGLSVEVFDLTDVRLDSVNGLLNRFDLEIQRMLMLI